MEWQCGQEVGVSICVNPEVQGSIPALGTCWICSQLSQVQIHGHWLPPASWGFNPVMLCLNYLFLLSI